MYSILKRDTKINMELKLHTNANEKKLERYLLPTEAADLLRISLNSFYIRAWKGDIPVIKLGGSLRVDRQVLEEFLKSKTRGGKWQNEK